MKTFVLSFFIVTQNGKCANLRLREFPEIAFARKLYRAKISDFTVSFISPVTCLLPQAYATALRQITEPVSNLLFNDIYMWRTMTKPALMTFSNIKAINFNFNAKLTDFAMFSYRFNIWLTYCLVMCRLSQSRQHRLEKSSLTRQLIDVWTKATSR